MKNRIELALSACEGLSNEELSKRGASGFANMITRKRTYAATARILKATIDATNNELAGALAKIQELEAQLAKANVSIAQLESLDAPITDTSEADAMLASALNKSAAE